MEWAAMRFRQRSPLCHFPAAKAHRGMVVHDPYRLHPGVDEGGAGGLEAAALQLLRDLVGERGLSRHRSSVTGHRPTIGERPAEVGEALAPAVHLTKDLCAGDRSLNLRA